MVETQASSETIITAAFVGSLAGTVINVLANIFIEGKRLRVAFHAADAAMKSAAAAELTAVNSDLRRQQELQRSGIAALCKTETDNLQQLRTALSELAMIARGGSSTYAMHLDEAQRQRGIFLSSQLVLMILPTTPLAEVLCSDVAKVGELLSKPNTTTTITNPSLWGRYFDNAMRWIQEEDTRIKRQLVEGRYIERESLKPQTTEDLSLKIFGHL